MIMGVKAPKLPNVTVISYCSVKKRLYYGLDNGDVCFWGVTSDGPKASSYVGCHKGSVAPVFALCGLPPREGSWVDRGLLLSGSVDGTIKVWDYQGRLQRDPSVLAQTIYAHSGVLGAVTCVGCDAAVLVGEDYQGPAATVTLALLHDI
eukprot:gene28023-31124_t